MRSMQGANAELIILPSLKAQLGANGGLVVTQKFLNGAAEYARTWPGPVTSLVNLATGPSSDMDHVEAMADDLKTGLEIRPKNKEALAERIKDAAIVLALLWPEEAETATLCHELGVPIVFITEYTPRTQEQILGATTPNLLRRWRRKIWIRKSEHICRQMLRDHASGLQCSGTPTYDLYSKISSQPLLFFDNRVRLKDIIDDSAMTTKCDRLKEGGPLRLVFGGRLIGMKGVMDLPRVALELDRLQIPYSMDIYGSGTLEEALRSEIECKGLSDRVTLHRSMDFETGWIPTLKQKTDLFVCCHPQGDPSSTYPEVMSCGTPIVGYANEAFEGIVRKSKAGRTVPVHDAAALAAQVAVLHNDREALSAISWLGRDFAREHCFEATFDRRVAHLIKASRLSAQTK